MRGLRDKVIVVAGAGSGIGAASAIRLAEEGAKVVVGDVSPALATHVAAEITNAGGIALGHEFDVSDPVSNEKLIARALEAFGRLDGLHLNAADMATSLRDADVLSVPLEVFDRLIAVNLRGHFSLTRVALPHLLQGGGGSIVYTTSTVAFIGLPDHAAYSASKSGLNSLVRHVATAWGRRGIRSNAVAPGMVLSEHVRSSVSQEQLSFGRAVTPSPRLGEVTDIAAAVAFLMSDDACWINGQVIAVDGGATMRQ
jgi:NAD(P)-dependent dehydrogenase (short-subunit alcohol dehydrogenase family)